MRSRRLVGGLAALATAVSGSALVAMAVPASAGSSTSPAFARTTTPDAVVSQRGNDGSVRVIEPKGGTIARPRGVAADAKPETAAKAHLSTYAKAFGVSSSQLTAASSTKLANGSAVRFDRSVDGVPVFAGQLVVALDQSNNLQFIAGETGGKPTRSFPSVGKLQANKFAGVARKVVATREKLGSTAGLKVRSEGRNWYDGSILGVPGAKGVQPVYTYVVGDARRALQYRVLVDASTGKAALAYSLTERALNRVVCDAKRRVDADTTCDGDANPYARVEGQGPSGVADVNKVYDFFKDTSVRYASYVNLDLTKLIGIDYGDGKGKALRATVRVCTSDPNGCPFANAYWDGQQMVFGEGVTTDDVTGHELTHGVTERTAALAYLYQSGAINEGLSDAWGEIVDLTNGSADDTAANRWKIAEGSSLGVIRDMKNPNAYDQPDKMTSGMWYDDVNFEDNGGVHYNSGVFNKSVYLLADGASFNGYTVRGLGLAKTAKVLWTTQNLLAPGADYKDVFYTMPLACRKNIGQVGTYITEDDCQQVDKAVRATEMYKDPVRGSAKNVDYCANGTSPKASYTEGFESKSGGWTFQGNWVLSSEVGMPYATVGKDSATSWTNAGDNVALTQKAGVKIPAGSYLRFDHSYLIENGDGARIEYNSGSGWHGMAALPNVNGEDTPAAQFGGLKSFAGTSNGFGGTRYDLSSLSGRTVQFRFHSKVGTDTSYWWVDNLKIYTCG
ncbi:M4 family metallopeptidase [Actinopolymorpha cephalotaxi]|uniref:Zn-dependent metalloprotease n=1 Tax=Actinopolymorpha cephalotaxi TaxID=504797 RepID=A0ABX2S9G7_9ACTN|nr:M4 family metallopeptidase [Actinopolymorpha cephalotaxi]NYH86290.1 Zn-dependent metalloprotease [Actinopolymorpha cephalotaxi]